VVGAAALVTAMWVGLYRSGWQELSVARVPPLAHGPLMVCAFLGTLISLEKAVAVDRWWAFVAPALAAVGGLWLVARADPGTAAWLFTAASLLFALVLATLLMRRVDLAGGVMLAGALAWLGGNLLWLAGRSIPLLAPWWIAFPVLVIVGERLELSRVVAPSRQALAVFHVALAVYLTGLGLFVWNPDSGLRLQGAGQLLLALWLLRHDLARRTVKIEGRHRYTALCLLSGFFWLAVSGGLALVWGADLGGLRYDAWLHSLLLGFVFGMIFGHAPIIAPMLVRRNLAWGRQFHAPLLLLQASLVLRLAGDLLPAPVLRAYGAVGNVAAILLFLMVTVRAVVAGQALALPPS